MSKVTLAATQMACSWDREANVARAEKLIREAAGRGANVVLIQELFETPYFCKDHAARYFDLAKPLALMVEQIQRHRRGDINHDLGGTDRVPSTLSRISGATLPHTIVGQRGGATLTSCHISSAQRRFLVERALGEAATVLCMYSHSPT